MKSLTHKSHPLPGLQISKVPESPLIYNASDKNSVGTGHLPDLKDRMDAWNMILGGN